MYKNQLQELAQRSCFNLPSYSCVREGPDHAPRFKAKVNFNGEIFESPSFCSNLRQAEHAAAEVALRSLSQRGPSRALTARVLDETGIYKNLLQETAHRAGLKLPVYTTVRSGPAYAPLFTCTVELNGMTFSGEPAKTKKQAQKSAAMASWFSLKNLAQQEPSSSVPGGKDEQEQATVARYLARLRLSESRKTAHKQRCQVKQEYSPIWRDVGPSLSVYEMQQHALMYPNFLPEVALYPSWNQQVIQQQRLQYFPFPPSILGPQTGLYPFAEFSPVFYLSNDMVPRPIGVNSQVTIEEIQETAQVEEGKETRHSNEHDKSEIEKGKSVQDVRNSCRPETSPSEEYNSRSRTTHPVGQNLSSSVRLPYNATVSSSRPTRGPLVHPPHPILRASGADSECSTRFFLGGSTMSSPTSSPRNAVYPSLRSPFDCVKSVRGASHAGFMAPAVQIRSVLPVCSAPPVRQNSTSGQERKETERK